MRVGSETLVALSPTRTKYPSWLRRSGIRRTASFSLTTQPAYRWFYYRDRLIAVLRLGAQTNSESRLVILYYVLVFMPGAGLREPLKRHHQSVLPHLKREGRAESYRQDLHELAQLLETCGPTAPDATFGPGKRNPE